MKLLGNLVALGFAAVIVFGLLFASQAYLGSPQAGSPSAFEVRAGDQASSVASRLAEARIISSAFWYRIYVWFDRSADAPPFDDRIGPATADLAVVGGPIEVDQPSDGCLADREPQQSSSVDQIGRASCRERVYVLV